jgi:microcystin-dependent protein
MTAPNPDPFTGEIRIFPFNHAPKGWAECNGQLLSITANTALFSIIGTTYGGDGKSTFGLPNLQGSVPAGPGHGRGLSPYSLGGVAGSETVTLTWAEMPSHNHQVAAQTVDQGDNRIPTANLHLGNTEMYSDASVATATLDSTVVANAGESRPHNNLMPYLTFNFCIALQGIFPERS